MEDVGISALIRLTVRLEKTAPRSFAESERMISAHSFDWSGPSSDVEVRAHYDRYRQRAYDALDDGGMTTKERDQSLEWNVRLLDALLNDWFANAHTVPPHSPTRICVLLRKAKQHDLEHDFLRAFIPHYRTPFINAGNDSLIARAEKINARWA